MGGCGSKNIQQGEKFPAHRYSHLLDFFNNKCHFSGQDLDELYFSFRKVSPKAPDHDIITFDAYCDFLYFEKRGRFLRTMVLYFSADQETLTFPEFVLLMSVFSVLPETALAKFLFVVITDGDYILSTLGDDESLGNMEHLIKELFGNAWGNEAKITKILAHMGKGQSITSDLFVNYCVSNRSLLHMPMTHQLAIRGKIVSKDFWKKRESIHVPLHSVPALRLELLELEVTGGEPNLVPVAEPCELIHGDNNEGDGHRWT